jgi:hypothetical protein
MSGGSTGTVADSRYFLVRDDPVSKPWRRQAAAIPALSFPSFRQNLVAAAPQLRSVVPPREDGTVTTTQPLFEGAAGRLEYA